MHSTLFNKENYFVHCRVLNFNLSLGLKFIIYQNISIADKYNIPLEEILETSSDKIIHLKELDDINLQKVVIFDYVRDKIPDEISKYV